MLGAVSEEQAAEAAAEQTQSAEENAVDDEAEDNSVGGVETMEDDELEVIRKFTVHAGSTISE